MTFHLLWHSLLKMASMHQRSWLKMPLFCTWLVIIHVIHYRWLACFLKPQVRFHVQNLLKNYFFGHLGIWEVSKGYWTQQFAWVGLKSSLQVPCAATMSQMGYVQVEKFLRGHWWLWWRSGVKKVTTNMFFLINKHKRLIEILQINYNLKDGLTVASVCRTGT